MAVESQEDRTSFVSNTQTDKKSVVLSSDFAAANQRRDRLPLIYVTSSSYPPFCVGGLPNTVKARI